MTLNDLIRKANETTNMLSGGDIELVDADERKILDVWFSLDTDEEGNIKHIIMEVL